MLNKFLLQGITGGGILLSISAFDQPKPDRQFAESLKRGKLVYETVCLACHQSDGGGVPRMNPPLIKTTYVLGDKSRLIKIVLNGLQGGELEVSGENYENPMPAQKDNLTDLQIADVLTYVRNHFGNKAGAVTPAEIGRAHV